MSGISSAVRAAHPGATVTFGVDELCANDARGRTYVYAVADEAGRNAISEHPKTVR
jgi:hypothetical protein